MMARSPWNILVFTLAFVIFLFIYKKTQAVQGAADNVGFATLNHPPANRAQSSQEALGVNPAARIKAVDPRRFAALIQTASDHPRKRKMTDLTLDPMNNPMQILLNTWTAGSLSPVHKHDDYTEVFVVLEGALSFFTFSFPQGDVEEPVVTCHILSHDEAGERAIIVEKGEYHAMAAAPPSLGYPGNAIIFEISGHKVRTRAIYIWILQVAFQTRDVVRVLSQSSISHVYATTQTHEAFTPSSKPFSCYLLTE